MTAHETEAFEQFLAVSFAGGIRLRELRLSEAELQFITARYPNACTKPLEARAYPDGKLWFEVSL